MLEGNLPRAFHFETSDELLLIVYNPFL